MMSGHLVFRSHYYQSSQPPGNRAVPARKPPEPPTAPDDPAEYERFVEIARELGVDETPDALDRAFDKVIRPASPAAKTGVHHRNSHRTDRDGNH